jgi:hypothetical protein
VEGKGDPAIENFNGFHPSTQANEHCIVRFRTYSYADGHLAREEQSGVTPFDLIFQG